MKTTRQHYEAINRFLDRLKHRARWLLIGGAASRAVAAAAVVLMGAGLALSFGIPSLSVVWTTATLGLATVTASTLWPLRARWAQAQSARVAQQV